MPFIYFRYCLVALDDEINIEPKKFAVERISQKNLNVIMYFESPIN